MAQATPRLAEATRPSSLIVLPVARHFLTLRLMPQVLLGLQGSRFKVDLQGAAMISIMGCSASVDYRVLYALIMCICPPSPIVPLQMGPCSSFLGVSMELSIMRCLTRLQRVSRTLSDSIMPSPVFRMHWV